MSGTTRLSVDFFGNKAARFRGAADISYRVVLA